MRMIYIQRYLLACIVVIATMEIMCSSVSAFQVPAMASLKRNRSDDSIILNSHASVDGMKSVADSSQSHRTFYHPLNGVEVTLIGCLHGSESSAIEVDQLLREKRTDAIVLELCPTRYKDLTRENAKKIEREKENGVGATDFINMVTKTIEARGVSTGFAAAILGAASSISNSLSGFEQGLEFIRAIEFIDENDNDNYCDIILADRIVDETLRQVGSVPSLSMEMLQTYILSGFNWEKSYENESKALRSAVFGDDENDLDMTKALFRNPKVTMDLIRLTLPSILLVEAVNIGVGQNGSGPSAFYPSLVFDLLPSSNIPDLISIAEGLLFELVSSAILLFLGYIIVALPTVKVILTERDEQLAKGIDDACARVAERYEDSHRIGRVVCVVGFLHVNGILKRISHNK